MNVTRLALAYAARRPLSTLLVVLLLAAGTAVVTLTLIIARELETRLTRDAEGIDLVVGAKGSPLQLVLAGVYHVDVAPGNIPLGAVAELRANRLIAQALPIALGDSFRGFRIVGTEPGLVDHYRGKLARGALWQRPMEAVLGSAVASASGLDIDGTFAGSHGLSDAGAEHSEARYRVTGVLSPTGTVMDRMVLTSIESVWAVHDAHLPATPAKEEHDKHGASGGPTGRGEGDADREVTMVLVSYAGPLAAASLPRELNERTNWVAASPAYETARLLSVFGVGIDLLRTFAYLLIGASALMLFVALAQALDERRYDLAILRALGAHRAQVAWVLMAESIALAATGLIVGLSLAHGVAGMLGEIVPAAAVLAPTAWRFAPEEAWVAAIALGAGILAALWPAWRAYRLDVATTLADT